jgi:hypothetical protein
MGENGAIFAPVDSYGIDTSLLRPFSVYDEDQGQGVQSATLDCER